MVPFHLFIVFAAFGLAESQTRPGFLPTRPRNIRISPETSSRLHATTESLISSWQIQPTFKSIKTAVFVAAAQAPTATTFIQTIYSVLDEADSTRSTCSTVTAARYNAQLSLAVDGYDWDVIVAQDWYEVHMEERWRREVDKERDLLQGAMNSIAGTAVVVGGGGRKLDIDSKTLMGVMTVVWFVIWVGYVL